MTKLRYLAACAVLLAAGPVLAQSAAGTIIDVPLSNIQSSCSTLNGQGWLVPVPCGPTRTTPPTLAQQLHDKAEQLRTQAAKLDTAAGVLEALK